MCDPQASTLCKYSIPTCRDAVTPMHSGNGWGSQPSLDRSQWHICVAEHTDWLPSISSRPEEHSWQCSEVLTWKVSSPAPKVSPVTSPRISNIFPSRRPGSSGRPVHAGIVAGLDKARMQAHCLLFMLQYDISSVRVPHTHPQSRDKALGNNPSRTWL